MAGKNFAVNLSSSTVQRILITSGVGIVLLHFYAALQPSSFNWGFHHLAFFPSAVKFGIPLAMLSFLFAPVQKAILRVCDRCISRFHAMSRRMTAALLSALFAGVLLLFWYARERFFLLGDGTLVVRLVKALPGVENIPRSFPHEPLPGFLMWKSWQLFSSMGMLSSEEFAIQIVSIICGGISLVLIVLLSRLLVHDAVDRVLMAGFLVAAGGSQLFFGYVENYAPLYAGFLFFLWLSLLYLKDKGHLALPSMAFGLLFTLHFSMLCLVPALGILLYHSIRRNRWFEIPSSVFALIIVTVAVLWMCGYSVSGFLQILFQTGTHLLPLDKVTTPQQAYTLFSSAHFAELGNMYMLLSPFALIILAIVGIFFRKSIEICDTTRRFLFMVAGGGALFSALVSLDLGMSRDWDVLATYGLGIIVVAGVFWFGAVSDRSLKQRMMVMMVGITILHTASWVALNADEERASSRFQMLPDRRIWGRNAVTAAYEELAVYYRRRTDAAKAILYFKRYLEIDSANGRIWAGLANIYRLTADTEHEIIADQKAIACRTTIPDVYINLSIIYANQQRIDEALEVAKKGWELNPMSPLVNNNLGALMLRKDVPCDETLPYFIKAIQIDPTYADAYYNAGICAYDMKDLVAARRYLQQFLSFSPDSEAATFSRKILESIK